MVAGFAIATVEDPKPLEDFLAATQAHAQEKRDMNEIERCRITITAIGTSRIFHSS